MKKFTLLIAMLFCAIGIGQNTNVTSVSQTEIAIKSALTKKAAAQETPVASALSVFPSEKGKGAARNAAAFTKKSVAKKATASREALMTSDDPIVNALLERLASVGNQAGSIAEHFTAQEQAILKNHFAVVRLNAGITKLTENSATMSNATSYDNYEAAGIEVTQSNRTSYITGNTFGPVTPYTDLATFQADAGGALVNEDFDGGPAGIVACGPIISSAGDGCFPAGELVDGFNMTASNGTDVISIEAGSIGNVSDVVGANTFVEFTIINFTGPDDVFAVGQLIFNNLDLNTEYRVFDQGGALITSFTANNPTNTENFFGVISTVAIGRVEIEGANGSGELIANLFFGGSGGGGGGGTPVAYGWESQGLGYGSLDPADPSAYTTISAGSGTADFESSGAIDPNDPTTGYAADNVGLFWSVDVATGVYTQLGNLGVADITGLEFNPVDGTLYASTSTALYTVDTGAPSATLVGNFSTAGLAIALAIDGAGNGYTYDIIDDSFYTVDLATGATTLVGAIGFDANFGQGMCWDPNTDQVYMAAFNNTAFDAEIRTVDVATGATTLVGPFLPGNLNQLAWMTIPEVSGGGGGGSSPCSQTNPSNGFENGFFTGSGPTAPNQLIAGDIIVPADTDFSMTTINANLMVNPGETVAAADLIIYDNAGGFPGAAIATYGASVPSAQVVIGTAFGFDVLDVTFDIPATDLAGQAGVDTNYWLSIYIEASDLGDGLWEATTASVPGFEAVFSVDNGATWAGAVPGTDVVYTYAGDCTPIGGGGGNDCSIVGPSNGFENGKSFLQSNGWIVAHDIQVPADQNLLLEAVNASVFAGVEGSGDNVAFVDITIWGDNGGQPDPGNVIVSVPGFVPTNQTVIGANFGFNIWDVELDHPDVLLDGQAGVETTYWFGISGEATDAGNLFWENSTAGLIGNGEAFFDGGFVIDPTLEGVYTFSATCEELVIFTYDDCEGALPITCGDVVQGDTLSATIDTGVAPECDTSVTAPGVWYKFEDTSGLASNITLTTCSANTDYDTKISVYTGECNNPPLTCVVGNDDDPDCTDFQSSVEFSSDGNTTFYILIHGFSSATGNFELSMTCDFIPPPNDEIQNAIDLDEVGCPFTDEAVAMPAATTENGNPTDCDISGANGVWYVFTPELNGFITGTISTPAGFSSVTFYTAPDESSVEDELTLVDYFENQCLPSESATIPVTAGQSYYCFVVNSGGITDIVFDNCQLGVNSNEIQGFAYYPNPTNDKVNLSSVENIEKVALYNILGQKLIDLDVNATTTELNVSNLSAGAYIMEVTVNGQRGTYKVIKR